MYHDIATQLIQAITRGDYDTKLPTEAAMMAQFEVSRNTIRRAIDVVYQQGLLRRVQGSGYYINQARLDLDNTVNLSVGAGQPVFSDAPHPESTVVTNDLVQAEAIALACKFSIPPGTELHRVVRLRTINQQLHALEESYYLTEVVPYLAPESLTQSIFNFLKDTYHITVTSSDDYLSMTALAADQAALLGLAPGTLRLTLAQMNYTKNNQLFNFSRAIYADDEMKFYFHTGPLQSN